MPRTLLVLLVAGSLSLTGCRTPRTPPLELPAPEHIEEMRASITGIDGFFFGPIPEFVVPPEHVPKILFCLGPAEPDRYSVSQGVERGIYFHVADVLILTKDGHRIQLRCHDWGCNPVAFTPNGRDYYLGHSRGADARDPDGGGHDGGVELCNAIKEAREARGK